MICCVRDERLGLVLARSGHFELLLGARDRRFRGRDLGFSHAVPARRLVDVLLGHEIRPVLQHVRETRRSQVCDLVRCLGALEVRLRPLDLLFGSPDGGRVLLQLVLEFGNLEHGQQLARGHTIADVHLHGFHEAGDFGVDVDFLKRPELRRDGEGLHDVSANDLGDGHRRVLRRPPQRPPVGSNTRRSQTVATNAVTSDGHIDGFIQDSLRVDEACRLRTAATDTAE